ncbi:MAG: YifB family Mg chelatase-like AAA ATPase [Planctomycetes bacterium]|nr:YifB family Mg chelatase-like AAA ATPase [Planctomycetota bacterium]
MVVQLASCDVFGIEGRVVQIEVDLLSGAAAFVVSGHAGKGIRESRDRVRSAIVNCGFYYPFDRRVVVNLAPATWEKDGSAFDLAIALGILIDSDQVPGAARRGWGVLGELSLNGSIRPISGVLALLAALRGIGIRSAVIPCDNLVEGSAVDGIESIGARNLREAVAVLSGDSPGVSLPAEAALADSSRAGAGVSSEVAAPPRGKAAPHPDLGEVVGHGPVKRALAIAVAGGHNVLLAGAPGAGKSFLARRMPGLLPPLSRDEVLEVTSIHSAAGIDVNGLISQRPFRAPHHTVSWAGLVGGGAIPRPGEITLAHRGVLFLDELPEFPRRSLEALREPLEDGRITIARARATLTFPAAFLLVAAMNPCPCGNYRHPRRVCHCPPERVRKYLEKISGPLIDRIDMRIEILSQPGRLLLDSRGPRSGSSGELRELVLRAQRFREAEGRPEPNRTLGWRDRERWAPLSDGARRLFLRSTEEFDISTRALTRILRLARTIADAAEAAIIEEEHLLEAIEYHSPRGGAGSLALLGSL